MGLTSRSYSQVRSAIYAWDLPVDLDVAALLTSELVTNALMREGRREHHHGHQLRRRSSARRRPRFFARPPARPVVVDAQPTRRPAGA